MFFFSYPLLFFRVYSFSPGSLDLSVTLLKSICDDDDDDDDDNDDDDDDDDNDDDNDDDDDDDDDDGDDIE